MRLVASVVWLAAAPLFPAETKPLTVKEDNYSLRAGCSGSAESVAVLKKGDPVRIRFALAGENGAPCYAVSAESGGKKVQGYVSASALAGLEEFEQARRSASSSAAASLPPIDRSQVQSARSTAPAAAKTGKVDYALAAQLNLAAAALQAGRTAEAEKILAKAAAPRGHREVALLWAYALLQLNQPDKAMGILETALRENQKDPQLLSLAGKAAYDLDDSLRALAYWKESLELHPDPSLEALYRNVARELGAEKSSEKSYGMRFLLRYETVVAGPEAARSMVDVLEEEFSRISQELGCPTQERIITIVQSRESYRFTGMAEWNGAHYDGKIRVPLAPARKVDVETRRTFAHEIVHACLSNIGPWPAWLHEGLAQRLSGERLQPPQRDVLKVLARAGRLPKLDSLGNGWARMNITQASVAYSVALAAVELFYENYSQVGPRNLLNNAPMLEQITPELDRRLEESLKSAK